MRKVFARFAWWLASASFSAGLCGAESPTTEIHGTIRYDGPLEGKIIVQAWQPRPGNHALHLDGKTGYVITQLTDLSGPELTIQFWFRGTSVQSAVRQQNGGREDFEEEWSGRSPPVIRNPPRGWIVVGWHGFNLISNDGLLNGLEYDPDIVNDHWHHVAMTWKQNTKNGFASYLDGRRVYERDTRNVPIPNYNTPVYFGAFRGAGEFANGLLDQISIWKRALTESEITNSWHNVLTGNEPGLVGYWNFDDRSANDASPNHFHGELHGDAAIVDADIPGLGSAVLSTQLTKSGHYQLTNLAAGADYRIVAFLDVNGNGVMDPWEPRSEEGTGLLHAGAGSAGLDLRLGIPIPFWRAGWFIVLSGFLFIAAVGGLFWFLQTRKLRRRFEELRRQHQLEHERGRIARDIHDELGAKLTRISYLSEVAKHGAEVGRRPELEVLGTATRDLLRTLDTIVWAVSPRNDTLENLVEYACQYAREFFSMTRTECQVSIAEDLPDRALTSQARHELLRVIQENLNNVLKHADATRVILKFEVRESELWVTIADNGRGFDLDNVSARRAGGGNGLRIMRERMADLGGILNIQSIPGKGTTTLLILPLVAHKNNGARRFRNSAPAVPAVIDDWDVTT